MRKLALLAVLLPLSAAGNELRYDEVFLHYISDEIRDPSALDPDRLDAFEARIFRQVSENWFATATAMYSDNEWDVDLPYPYTGRGADSRQTYAAAGLGRRFALTESTDLFVAGLVTYSDYETTITAAIGMNVLSWRYSSHDVDQRLEVGVRSMATERLEVFGLLAQTNDFDDTVWHVGTRYAFTETIDGTLRFVQTDDVNGLWAGVVFQY